MNSRVFVIIAKNITNTYLIEDGWKNGDHMHRALTEKTRSSTFDRGDQSVIETYGDIYEAHHEIALRKKSFVGVEFDVVDLLGALKASIKE